MSGGDVCFHRLKQGKFTEAMMKFIVVCTVLGLEYFDINRVMHRDIKLKTSLFTMSESLILG